jgi:hypothetical protein
MAIELSPFNQVQHIGPGANEDDEIAAVIERMAALERDACARYLHPRYTLRSFGWLDTPEPINMLKGEVLALHYPAHLRWRDATTSGDEGAQVDTLATVTAVVLVAEDTQSRGLVAARSSIVPYAWKRVYFANAYLPLGGGQGDLLQLPMGMTDAVFDRYEDGERAYWAWYFIINLELHYNMPFEYGRNFG